MIGSDIDKHTVFVLFQTFVIEEKFGFNKIHKKTVLIMTDKLKGWVECPAFLGGGILARPGNLVFSMKAGNGFLDLRLGDSDHCIHGISSTSVLQSGLIVPLFNKQTPLEDQVQP